MHIIVRKKSPFFFSLKKKKKKNPIVFSLGPNGPRIALHLIYVSSVSQNVCTCCERDNTYATCIKYFLNIKKNIYLIWREQD
jgi:hypothetical protein